MTSFEPVLNQVLELSKQKGATASEVILNRASTVSFHPEDKQISEYKVADTHILGIRLIYKGGVGLSYCEDFSSKSLGEMVHQAIENAHYNAIKDKETIEASQKETFDGTSKDIYQEDSTPVDKKIKAALYLEEGVKSHGSHFKITPFTNLREMETEVFIANSLGTLCKQKQRLFSAEASAIVEKDNNRAAYFKHTRSRSFDELNVKSCVEEACTHAEALLTGIPLKTGTYEVIFYPDIISDLFSGFSHLLSAKTAMEGLNPWKEKVGQPVASPLLNLTDSPKYKDGFFTTHFDDEGFLTHENQIIENGVLKTFYHNSSTARHFDVPNTHTASRSPKDPLNVGGTHQIITPSKKKENPYEGSFVEVIEAQGLYSGLNSTTGNFSFGASGYLYENGKKVRAFKETTLSGNFFEILQNISVLGGDLKSNSSGCFFTPSIRFSGLTLAG